MLCYEHYSCQISYFLYSNLNFCLFSFFKRELNFFSPPVVLQSFCADRTFDVPWFYNEMKKCHSFSDFAILFFTNYSTVFQIILVQSHHFYIPAEVHFNIADVR